MELFRDETTIALDAVAVACREAVDIHRTAANAVADAELAASLRELADARERAAEYLANVLCALADGPNRPPEELELLKQAVVWGRALIGGGPASVLQSSRAQEEKLVRVIAEARKHRLDDATMRLLAELQADAEAKVREFAAEASNS